MRYAIYFTPPADDPLTRAAIRWIGRDAFTNLALAPQAATGLDVGEMAFVTAAPRRYGFHATLKAPFQLRKGETESSLLASLEAFAARRSVTIGPRLILGQLDGFFALVPEERSDALQALADDIVTEFDRFRAPLSDGDFERRNPGALSSAQLKNLTLWGYPYVFDTFRFHMTLTGRVEAERSQRVMNAIVRHFGPLLDEPIELSGVALFVEPGPGEPFTVKSLHPFRGKQSVRFG